MLNININNDMKQLFKRYFLKSQISLLFVFFATCIVFTILSPNYFTPKNFLNILTSGSLMGLVAVGESYLIISGNIDLSPGSVSAFSGVLSSVLLGIGFGAFPTLIIVVVVGLLIGFLNSILVNIFRIEPFIATLGTMQIFKGLAFIINNGKAKQINDSVFLKLGVGKIIGIPIPVWILILTLIVFSIILQRTRFGRNIYIIGGNSVAARLAGINSKKTITKLYMICSGLTGLGGALLASRMNSGQPTASSGLEFDGITAAVLGGIALKGGVGSISGTILGIFILQSFNNGLLIMNVPQWWQYVAKGLLLVVAVTFDYVRNRKQQDN